MGKSSINKIFRNKNLDVKGLSGTKKSKTVSSNAGGAIGIGYTDNANNAVGVNLNTTTQDTAADTAIEVKEIKNG